MATTRFLSLIVLIAAALAAPFAHAQETSASTTETITISDKDGVQRWRTSTLLSDFNIESRGKIELTDDDKDIKSISDDGYLEINKTVFGSRRTIIIESLGGGKLKKEYYEGRTKMDWDPNGKEWLSQVLPELVRNSTIGADSRVNRFFAKGGAAGVLNEINRMESDYVKSHYGKLLLQKDIPAGDMPKVIENLAASIESDYYLSSLLKDSMDKLMPNKQSADAFFKASDKIESDYYKSVLLKSGLQKFSASPDQVKSILRAAANINSDYYLSVVLTALLEEGDVKEESMAELINVSREISSDYYRTEVLKKAVQKPGASAQAIRNAVGALADVGSDYYKTAAFNVMAERNQISKDLQPEVIRIISESVGSDYYAATTYAKIMKHQDLSDESFEKLVLAAGNLSSSNYASDVLQKCAQRNLTTRQLLAVLKAAEGIDSDHYLSTVLISLAPKVRSADATTKDAYRAAAKKIGSETYYGRAIRAID